MKFSRTGRARPALPSLVSTRIGWLRPAARPVGRLTPMRRLTSIRQPDKMRRMSTPRRPRRSRESGNRDNRKNSSRESRNSNEFMVRVRLWPEEVARIEAAARAYSPDQKKPKLGHYIRDILLSHPVATPPPIPFGAPLSGPIRVRVRLTEKEHETILGFAEALGFDSPVRYARWRLLGTVE